MPQTLAQIIKAKHPGVYDDIPDAELEAKVSAKFPGVYDDIPRTAGGPVAPIAAPAAPAPAAPVPSAPAQSFNDRANEVMRTVHEWERNLAVGGLKGLGSVAMSALRSNPVELGRSATSAALGALGMQQPADPMREAMDRGEAALQPEGAAQKVGSFAARAVPSVAAGLLTGGAWVPAQAAMQGGLSAAQSQSKGFAGKALDAAGGVLGTFGGALAGKALERAGNLAVREYIKALAPTKEANKAIAQRITPELIKRGVWGSLQKLKEIGAAGASSSGKAIGQVYDDAARLGVKIDAASIATGLESLKKPFIGQGPNGPVVLHDGAVAAIEKVQTTLREFGKDASPDQLWKFRKVLDDIVQSSNGFTNPLPPLTAKAIAKDARRAIQEVLTKATPSVEKLNSTFALWKGLADVAGASVARKAGQSGIVGDALRSGAAGAAGASFGGPVGITAAAIPYVYTRPAVRTLAAVGLDRAKSLAPVARATMPTVGGTLADLLQGQE